MSGFKGTPGPWSVGKIGNGFINQVLIQPCIGVAYGSGEEVKANSTLIAAAPDLLEAITDLFQSIQSEDKPRSGAELSELREVALTKTRAAIRKALGQETEPAQ